MLNKNKGHYVRSYIEYSLKYSVFVSVTINELIMKYVCGGIDVHK